MKITIDTKEDSKAEIRKVINLLSNMVQEEVHSNNDLFSTSKDVFSGTRAESELASSSNTETSTDNQNAFANMFGETSPSASEEPTIDLANLSALREPKKEVEEEKEDVKVISY